MPGQLRLLVAGLVALSACSAPAPTTTTTQPAADPAPSDTSSTTVPIVSVDASFAISRIAFGEEGRIELVNTGPQPGNIHGHWIAIHPFYLELPSRIIESGETVVIALGGEELPEGWVDGVGLLPVLGPAGGEVALYRRGTFGNPDAMVDYVEWGSGGHRRSTVAIAAGLWDEALVIPMAGNEAGLVASADAESRFETFTDS